MKTIGIVSFIFIITVVLISAAAFYTVAPGDIAIVTQFGKIVGTSKSQGLHFKIPFIQKDHHYSTARLHGWQGYPHKIPTLEKNYIEVTASVRWKIVDPILFFKTVYRIENANMRVGDLIDSALRASISSRRRNDMVSEQPVLTGDKTVKPVIKDEIVRLAGPRMSQFGMKIMNLDIRIRDPFPESG